MKRPVLAFFLLLSLVFTFANCARRGTPDGGPLDITPPEYIKARPENFTTNFDAEAIRIFFNEYVKLQDPQRQIIISPPMDPPPEITPLGTASKSITIRIRDTLQENTTYTVNFGRSIIDNNEGNPLDYFTYAFSTGLYIDSLTVAGSVGDALLKVPDPFISVLLYEVDSTYTDSAVYNRVPRYVTNTLDSATTFELKNLKEGTYQLVGLRDLNNNYRYDPATEKIAFADEYITIPTESVYDLILFREVLDDKFIRPSQKAQQHLLFGYEGDINRDSLEIELLNAPEGFESRITKDAEKDTLHYWYKPLLERDSLKFAVSTPLYRDTLLMRIKEMKKDSLQFTFQPSGNIGFEQDFRIVPSVPLVEVNDSLIQLTNRDTVPVPFDAYYDEWNNAYVMSFPREEKQMYRFTALPGAFKGFFGSINDTLQTQVRTQALSDLGNLTVNLQNVESYPILVQLTNEKGVVQYERYSTGQNVINFSNIRPATYQLRIIYDRNENRIWDTGSLLRRTQPEEVEYFPENLNIRANWDWNETFILE